MKSIRKFYFKCRKSDTNVIQLVLRFLYYKMFYRKNLLVHQNAKIKGVKNIDSNHIIEIGTRHVGFIYKADCTYLNIEGKFIIEGKYSIGRGCRINVGKNGIVKIGKGGFINCNTNIIIMNSLTIGDNCVISWDCQFLDEDFHNIDYDGKSISDSSIRIGKNVWIGCGAKIYKGSVIPDGCIVASDSIVKGVFKESNALIAGHPAKVIKNEVSWS